jgi:hypothetical protein
MRMGAHEWPQTAQKLAIQSGARAIAWLKAVV